MLEGAGSDGFYMTLPSNSFHAFYGNQHPARYFTRLETPINVDPRDYEVGLASITYPKSWHNVEDSSLSILCPSGLRLHTYLGASRFVSAEHLVRDVEDSIARALPVEHSDKVSCRYDHVSRRVRFTVAHGYALHLPYRLASPLGITDEDGSHYENNYGERGFSVPKRPEDRVTEGSNTVYVDRDIPVIYVYTDLASLTRVGDAFVPLLRTVDVPVDLNGDYVDRNFNNIHYTPLSRGNFETVEVHITDSQGRDISFGHGLVIVKLHFRRCRRQS